MICSTHAAEVDVAMIVLSPAVARVLRGAVSSASETACFRQYSQII